MASPVARLLALLVAAAAALAVPAGATQFRVGGQSGWSVPGAGSEPYNTWAGRLRFQIGDQLLFVYPKDTDSVLLVDAAAYNACNVSSYVARFDDGSTVFTFDRSGPFFFVSGNQASCRANEKLIVVVLADRSGTRTPPAAPPTMSPPPAAPSPAPLPSPPSPPPAAAPVPAPATSPPPSSGAAPPVPAPAATPTTSPPPSPASAPVPAPTTTTPSSPPAPAAQTPSPSTTPTPGGGGSSSPPPSASANAPAGGSGSGTPPPPSAAAPAVAGFVGSLGAFIGYAMLAA